MNSQMLPQIQLPSEEQMLDKDQGPYWAMLGLSFIALIVTSAVFKYEFLPFVTTSVMGSICVISIYRNIIPLFRLWLRLSRLRSDVMSLPPEYEPYLNALIKGEFLQDGAQNDHNQELKDRRIVISSRTKGGINMRRYSVHPRAVKYIRARVKNMPTPK